jgi:succinyl-diaminopimelate desuccinylase
MKNNMSDEMRRRIDDWFDSRRDDLVRDVCRLVRVESVRGEATPGKPYGEGPARALETAADLLRECGFEPVNHANRVVTADLNAADPVLGILAHLDVVPGGDGWSASGPFEPEVRDGVLYGRGVIDDKGPAVAAVYALRAARELAPDLTKGCRLILGSAEETGHDDLTEYRKTNIMPPNVFTPDANYPVVNFEKGRFCPTFTAAWPESTALPRVMWIKGGQTPNAVPNYAEAYVEGLPLAYIQALCVVLSSKMGVAVSASAFHDGLLIKAVGRAAHAMMPEKGANAQTALLAVLAELPLAEGGARRAIKALRRLFPQGDTRGEALGIAQSDDISGPLTLNFGVLSLNETGMTANFDCRTPKCATEENLDRVALEALEKAGFTVTNVTKTPCHHTPRERPFVQTLLRVYEAYTGKKGECLALGGQTYVHDVEGGVAFGPAFPGVDNRLHGADEFISVADLIISAKMYTQIIIDMCS